jgi:integrase
MAKRRGKDEGAIYRRSDGLWVASLNLGMVNGKRKRKTVYGKTRREVTEKLRELQQQQQAGVNLAAERQTVEQYLSYWHQHHVQPSLDAATVKRYEQVIRHIVLAIGHVHLHRLSPQHIYAMFAGMQQYAPGTLRLHYSVLHNALKRAVRLGLISRNPADNVDRPRQAESPGRAIPREHEAAIFAELEHHRLSPMFLLAIQTGMRKGELIALLWSDIDFSRAELRIRQGKTPAARRTISLTTSTLAALRNHWELQALERLAHADWKEHGLVFPSEKGTPLTDDSPNRTFNIIQRKAGIPEPFYRIHDLRHTAATRMAEAEVNPAVVMQILGQSNVMTTLQIYTHVSSEAQRAALEKLEPGYNLATNPGVEVDNTLFNGQL